MQMIDGLAYLLVSERRVPDYVVRYSADEVAEIFTASECDGLVRGEVVIRGSTRWVNMVAAAYAARRGQAT